MRRNVKDLDGAKVQALDFLADAQSCLLITCANPETKTAPKMVTALPAENTLESSLIFLFLQVPKFREVVADALKKVDSAISKLN